MKDPFQDEMLEHRAKAPAIKGIKFVKRVQEHYDKCPECGGKLIHDGQRVAKR